MNLSDELLAGSLGEQNRHLKRRVEGLKGVINDQFFSMIHFCLGLPLGGWELAETMLRKMAKLHTQKSLASHLFRGSHQTPPSDITAEDALRFVIDIHVKEKMMDRDWFRIEKNGGNGFKVRYHRDNCFYHEHCNALVCDGFKCICVRRFFYEGIIEGMTDQSYLSTLHTPLLEDQYCSFSMEKVDAMEDTGELVRTKIAGAVEENAQLHEAVMKRTKQIEEQKDVLRDLKEKAELSAKIKSEFLANMSHEMLTPLTSIVGFARLIGSHGESDETSASYSNRIIGNADTLLYLVDQILELSKMEAGDFSLNIMPTTLQPIISEAVARVTYRAEEKRHDIAIEHDREITDIDADFDELRKVFINLIDNAVKFTPNNGTITIRSRDDGERINVSVEDTGVGINESDRQLIFDHFRQVDGSQTRKAGGVGIGLTLAKKIVECHKGTITLESEEGKGSRFTVSVPKRHDS